MMKNLRLIVFVIAILSVVSQVQLFGNDFIVENQNYYYFLMFVYIALTILEVIYNDSNEKDQEKLKELESRYENILKNNNKLINDLKKSHDIIKIKNDIIGEKRRNVNAFIRKLEENSKAKYLKKAVKEYRECDYEINTAFKEFISYKNE